MTNRTSQIVFAAALLLCSVFAHSQVTVAIAPDPHPQFLSSTGQVLAGGFLYTYIAGTNTLLNTYVDAGGVAQNTDPIPLDATGSPSNGSVQTGIWLANASYKFCAYNAALVQQWCTDNVTGYLNLLNLPNLWTFQQTFTLPIIDTATDNQIVFGQPGNQTTLDAPPPTGNVTIHLPNTADTLVGRATTDTLNNKTLITPAFNGTACSIVFGPGTYSCITNQNPTGTTTSTLTKLVNVPSQVQITSTSDTGGVIGICVSACGNTGLANIQQSGNSLCVFDGATTAGDYVQISSVTPGQCHDAGASPPGGGLQNIGRVLSTNGMTGTYAVNLFGPEIQTGVRTLCADGTTTTVQANVITQQIMKTCQIAAGALNALGKTFRMATSVNMNPGGAGPPTSQVSLGWGTSAALGTFSQSASQGASASLWQYNAQWICSTTATGVGGQLSCSEFANALGGSATLTFAGSGIVINADLTIPFFIGSSCTFSAGSVANICQQVMLTLEQIR